MSEQSEHVEKLVNELIGTGTLWPETVADLQGFVADAKAGTLWADDLNYLIALHAKVTGAPSPEPDEERPAPAADGRFEEIRRRFVERYHPETGTENDRAVRERVYGDFWREFEAVEAETR